MDWEKCKLEHVIKWYELTDDFKQLLLKSCDKIDQDKLRILFYKYALKLKKNEQKYNNSKNSTDNTIKQYENELKKIKDNREADTFLEKQLSEE